MSRSNGNTGYGGQAPQQGHPLPQHAPHPQQPVPQWRHPLDVDDGTQPPPQLTWPAPAHDPYANQHAPPQPPFYAQHPPQPQQGYAPYQPQHDAQADYGHPHQHYAPAHPGGHPGQGGLAAYTPQATQPPHDPAHYAPANSWPQQAAPDPRGYDLGDYAAGQPQQQPPQRYADQPFVHDAVTRPSRSQPPAGWPHPGQSAQQAAADAGFGSAFGELSQQRGQAPQQGYASPSPFVPGPAGGGHPLPHAALPADLGAEEYAEEEEFEDEEPRRGGRTLWVVGALVGAICLGGGLAYTYKIVSGGSRSAMTKTDVPPVKASRPATPSAQSGPKVGEKLPEVAPKSQVASESETGGARRVAIIPVGPDGGAQTAAPPPPQTVTPFPGMVLAQPPTPPSAVAPPARVPQQQAAALPPVQPKIVTPPPAPPQKVATATDAPVAPKKVVPRQKQDDAFSPTTPSSGGVASAVAPTPKAAGLGAGGNGFVAAILSTQKGRAEAMKAFADLQQKYSDVLAAKPAEVQEVNLGEGKGVWFRAVVGPPGSREAASQVCAQLLAAGHKGCFATAY